MTRPLDLLCCPQCRDDLEEEPTGAALTCLGCGAAYPVIDGIPVFLPGVMADREGLQRRYWDTSEKADLYDRKVEGEGNIFGTYVHRSELHGSVALYRPENLDTVLDAGCGNGRFMETFPHGAFKVGADASLNLLRHARHKGRGDFHVCCELEHLPFKDGVFGTVTCCRVLQHLRAQEAAVEELGRVLRPGGDLILQVYNQWNPKTLYKAIRMSAWAAPLFNAPFRLLFRSMSPFAPWGLDYDRYSSGLELRIWMRRAGLAGFQARGAGFGFHKYLLDPFYVNATLEKHAPQLLQRFYDATLAFERRWGGVFPWPWGMEKLAIRGTRAAEPPAPPLIERLSGHLEHLWRESPVFTAEARRELRRELSGADRVVRENRFHLEEAMGWLCRAQDATPDDGVSRAYGAGWSRHFQAHGWQPSYPETTGYLIPTFFDAAAALGRDELRERALRMARWEIRVQLPSGAVRGGTIDRPPSPAVFNTGQVILGWLRAHQESGTGEFLDAALRAGEFLLRRQGADGGWEKGNSRFAHGGATTYNARVGWSLILLGQASGEARFREAGERNLAHVLARQEENGWFRENCLSDPQAPLLHTLCYAVEGILGGAEATGNPLWLERARLSASALLGRLGPEGRIAGRLDARWQRRADWDCLTGSAQLAGILLRLHRLDGDPRWQEGARRLLGFIKSTQNCVTDHPGLRGGIKGSYPFDGGYARFEVINWAGKFFADALLLDGVEAP